METIVEGASRLRDIPVRFLFIGGGGKRERMGKMSEDLGLGNVRFLPYQPKENLRYSLACSDVSLVSIEEGVEGLSVPSKYYGILASGRPVIAMMAERSEVAISIRETGCGYVVPPKAGHNLVGVCRAPGGLAVAFDGPGGACENLG